MLRYRSGTNMLRGSLSRKQLLANYSKIGFLPPKEFLVQGRNMSLQLTFIYGY